MQDLPIFILDYLLHPRGYTERNTVSIDLNESMKSAGIAKCVAFKNLSYCGRQVGVVFFHPRGREKELINYK